MGASSSSSRGGTPADAAPLPRGQRLVQRSWSAWRRGDERALAAALAPLRGLSPGDLGVASLEWRLHALRDDPGGIRRQCQDGLVSWPDAGDLHFGLGWAASLDGDLSACRRHLEAAVACRPDLADAWHELGSVCLHLGDTPASTRAWERTWDLDHGQGAPLRTPAAHFDALVEDALDLLPDEVRQQMVNVAVLVEAAPDRCLVTQTGLDPRLLGLFTGADFSTTRAGRAMEPTTIHLFQRNLETTWERDSDLVDQVRITVLHEIGHWLGLDEDAVRGRGLG